MAAALGLIAARRALDSLTKSLESCTQKLHIWEVALKKITLEKYLILWLMAARRQS